VKPELARCVYEKYTLLYAKGHSAQPDMFWRTHHTKSDPKSMRVILFAYGEYKLD